MKAPAPHERTSGANAKHIEVDSILPPRVSVSIVAFRPAIQNSRRGFFDVCLNDYGVVIRDCVWHTSHGKSWMALPAKRDDQGQWRPVVVFDSEADKEAFQEAVRAAMAGRPSRNG